MMKSKKSLSLACTVVIASSSLMATSAHAVWPFSKDEKPKTQETQQEDEQVASDVIPDGCATFDASAAVIIKKALHNANALKLCKDCDDSHLSEYIVNALQVKKLKNQDRYSLVNPSNQITALDRMYVNNSNAYVSLEEMAGCEVQGPKEVNLKKLHDKHDRYYNFFDQPVIKSAYRECEKEIFEKTIQMAEDALKAKNFKYEPLSSHKGERDAYVSDHGINVYKSELVITTQVSDENGSVSLEAVPTIITTKTEKIEEIDGIPAVTAVYDDLGRLKEAGKPAIPGHKRRVIELVAEGGWTDGFFPFPGSNFENKQTKHIVAGISNRSKDREALTCRRTINID